MAMGPPGSALSRRTDPTRGMAEPTRTASESGKRKRERDNEEPRKRANGKPREDNAGKGNDK